MVVSLPQACLNSAPSVQNAQQQLRYYHGKVAVCKYPNMFAITPPGAAPFRYRSKGSGRAAQASSQGWSGHRSVPGSAALPRGSCSSCVSLHWFSPHHSLTAQVLLHKSWRVLKVWEPAVCLPSADKSHLSRPFLPNTEQYLAQGSYLNVDLQHKAETDLFSLQQQWLTRVTSAVTSYVCLHQVPFFCMSLSAFSQI